MPFLDGCIIAVTGDFSPNATLPNIQRWLRHAGAVYSPTMSKAVTHLVCSHKHYKKQMPMVRQAKALGTPSIVTWDWLEDCLLHRKRRAVRKGYLMTNAIKARQLAKAARKKARQKEVKAKRSAYIAALSSVTKSLQQPGYQLHVDAVGGFTWDAKLICMTKTATQRIRIRLVESLDCFPKHYAAYADFRGPFRHFTEVLCAPPSEFCNARAAFENFFKNSMGYGWERRFDGWELTEGRYFHDMEDGMTAIGRVKKERKESGVETKQETDV